MIFGDEKLTSLRLGRLTGGHAVRSLHHFAHPNSPSGNFRYARNVKRHANEKNILVL